MKKKKLHILMLAVLLTQSFGSPLSAFALTTDNIKEDSESADVNPEPDLREETVESQNTLTSETTNTTENSPLTEAKENTTVESTEQSTTENTPIPAARNIDTNVNIEDELLESMTLTNMDGGEFSQSTPTRLLNTTPVIAKLNFVVADKNYTPDSVYTMKLPDHLGYSDVSGEVANVGAHWAVDAKNKTLTITFSQRITETQFKLDLVSYVFTNSDPLITIETPGQKTNRYDFDLYEEVAPIKYEETTNKYGLKGAIYYNLDRTLSGSQTVEVIMSDSPGSKFYNTSQEPIDVFSYDVDINGNVVEESKQLLEKEKDYTLDEDNAYRGAVTITNMNQQKAYALSVDRALALENVSAYSYSFYNQYPTTKLGSVTLNRTTAPYRGLEFTAKTSKDQKSLKEVSLGTIQNASFQEKGNYYVYIYNLPTQTKVGEQIILESKNGQKIGNYQLSASDIDYNSVPITDFFDVKKEDNKLILTATKDSVLRIKAEKLTIPFEQKDINVVVSTPIIDNGKEIMLISDQFLQPISIINPNNVETAWGNYDQNGAYFSDTTIAIEGNDKNPVKNATIKIKHPNYLQLRTPSGEYDYYKLGKDYTIKAVEDGSLIEFTTPVTRSFNLDLGFNYIPDSLEKSKSIPIDTLPVTLSADEYEAVETTVRTGRKMYSERTLQGSENQFLVNARNDSFDSLSVTTKIPVGADVVFDIYDVSNDQVKSIYPQYWDRGYYFDKPLASTDPAYPTVTFDETKNSYTFDFGKTSKRYIIEYKYANGWIDTKTINVTGSTAEPLSGNQSIATSVSVENESTEILSASQTSHESLKNVTKNEVTTKNINNGTRKVKNPKFDISTKGTTNAGIDLNSIVVTDVPQDAYTIKQTATGAQIIFDDYTLTQNITITYNTISKNAGQISTETVISGDNLEQMTETRRTAATEQLVLRFSEGDAEGIVYLSKAQFHTYNENDQAINIPNVSFQLIDNVTNNQTAFTTDEDGNYNYAAIMSGEYTLKAVEIPENYTIAEEYTEGKIINLTKEANQIEIPLVETKVDRTDISAKDSTIYVGAPWNPEDNFTGATDTDGNQVPFDKITFEGTVDTTTVGEYEIIYRNQEKEAKATISVVDEETLVVKDSTLYVGDTWQKEDNFVSATDDTGKNLPIQTIRVQGTVDTTKPGVYDVIYDSGKLEKTAKITVKADQSTLVVKDSTIYVGDDWKSADNFVSATDRDGKTISFEEVKINGTVKTKEKGKNEVTYTIQTTDKTQSSKTKKAVQAEKQLTAVANITVLEKNVSKPNETTKNQTHTTKPAKQKNYPKTGEKANHYIPLMGLLVLSITMIGVIRLKRRAE